MFFEKGTNICNYLYSLQVIFHPLFLLLIREFVNKTSNSTNHIINIFLKGINRSKPNPEQAILKDLEKVVRGR